MEKNELLENAFKESKTSVKLDEITTATISKEELHKVIDECNAGDYLLIQSVKKQVAYFFQYIHIKK